MDELGPLNIEFLINNPELLSQANQAEAILQGVNEAIQESATKTTTAFSAQLLRMQNDLAGLKKASAEALKLDPYGANQYRDQIKNLEQSIAKIQSQSVATNKAIADIGNTSRKNIDGVASSLGALKNQLAQLNVLKDLTPDPAKITAYNQKIQQTQAEITKLSNVGKTGFDELGNAVKKTGNPLSAMFSSIRQLAYILPGIGIAGIFSVIGSGLLTVLEKTGLFSDKITRLNQQLRDNMSIQKALNDARLDAAKKSNDEIVSINELYKATQNLKLSIQDRTNAAIELQNLYPSIFGNLSTEAILAGKGAAAYKSLKEEVLALANAEAIKNKVSQLASRELDDSLKITDLQREQTRLLKVKAEAAKEYKNAVTGSDETNAYAKSLQANNDIKKVLKEIGNLQYDQNLILKERTELEKRIDVIELKHGTKVLTGGKDAIDEQGKNAIESQKNILKADLDTQNAIYENDTKSYNVRKQALQKALSDQLSIIQLSQKEDLLNTNISESAKKLILDKYNAEKVKATADFNRKLDELGKKKGGNEQSAIEELLNAEISLREKIKEFTDKSTAKTLSPDQQALTQISDQFAAITFQITQANAKYDAFVKKFGQGAVDTFNANPTNKTKLVKTDPATLNAVQNAAIDNQANLNENTYIQQDIEKKKKLYADYYAYRAKVGEQAASKEYAELLLSGKDFTTYLNNIQTAIPADDQSGAIQKRRELVKKFQEQNLEDQKKTLEQLTIQFEGYQQKRDAIIAVGQDNEKKLRESGYAQEADQAKRNYEDQLTALEESQFKKTDAYMAFFENIDTLTTSEAKKQIGALYGALGAGFATGQINPVAFNTLLKTLDSAEKTIDDRLPQGLKAIGSQLSNIGGEIGKFNEGLGQAVSTVGEIVSGIGSIKEGINSFTLATKDKNVFGQISSVVSIFSTAFSVIGALGSAVNEIFNSKATLEQIAYEQQQQVKSIEAVNKALERQLEITKQLYGPDRISGYLKQLADIKVAQEQNNALLQGKGLLLLTGDKQLDAEITKVNSGQSPSGFFVQRIFELKALGDSASTSGKSIEQLQQLLDQGKLDDKTSAIVQSLLDLQQQAVDTQNALNEDLTGTSFDSLTGDIVQMFQDGKTALNDFGDEFQKVMQTAILNSFKRDYLEKQLQGFYNDLAADVTAHGQLTSDDIAKLQAEYNTILQNANTQFQAIQQATGVNLTTSGSSASPNSLAGAITGITADQADLLAGQFGGLRLTQLETNEILVKTQADSLSEMKNQTLVQMQIEVNTKRTADNTDKMVGSLVNIDKNTSSDVLTGVLRAAGKN